MSNVRSIRDAKTASRQASEWLVLLETGEATAEDRARFDAWLREHPGHQAVFDELKGTWGRLHAMGRQARDSGLVEPDPDAVAKYLARSESRRGRGKWFGWSAAAAASVVVAVAGMLMYTFDSSMLYRTDVGQQTTITLPDRSTVELNTDTELQVAYSDTTRNIELFRGEAYFEVAHDPDRPFVVKAGHGAIRAVGTGFVVQVKANEVVAVTVTEGVVAVTHDTESRPDMSLQEVTVKDRPVPTLSKGQRVEYDRHLGQPAAVPPEELDRGLAWRQGMLIFDGQTLDEVIREVDRYTDTRLIIADGDLRQLRIGGAFKAGDVDALLEVLEKGFNITVNRDGPRTIYLHAAHTG